MEKYEERSFLDYYNKIISPRLKEIDTIIKCGEPLSMEKASFILDISKEELEEILHNEHLDSINYKNIAYVLEKGSSKLCKMYKREVELGSPFLYSAQDIAYIYGLDIIRLQKTCDKLNIKELTWQTLPIVFSYMPFHNENRNYPI